MLSYTEFYTGHILNLYPYLYLHLNLESPLKEPFKGNLGFPRKFLGNGCAVLSVRPELRTLRSMCEELATQPLQSEPGWTPSFQRKAWFPLKGSLKGDLDIGVDTDMDIDYQNMALI